MGKKSLYNLLVVKIAVNLMKTDNTAAQLGELFLARFSEWMHSSVIVLSNRKIFTQLYKNTLWNSINSIKPVPWVVRIQ